MTTLRAALFDIGDTLFGRESGYGSIVEEAAALGVTVPEADAARVWTATQAEARTAEEIAKGRDLSAERHRERWTALYGAADVFVEGLSRALYEREADPERWVAYTDTESTLKALHAAGVPMGIVSDTGWDYRSVLARYGWLDLFGSVVLSYEHDAAKPTPHLFLTACAELDADPSETLMVGDNALTDGGAINAGLRVLLLPIATPGGTRGLDLVLRLLDVAR